MTLSDVVEGPRNASRPRQGAVFVSIYSWTCVVLGVALARVVISGLHKVDFGRDDLIAFVGSFLFLGSTATWHYTVHAGLGRHVDEFSSDQVETFFKAIYAAQLVQLVVLALAKTSSVFLIERVVPLTQKERILLFGTVVSWFTYSALAIGLQCGLPNPWKINEKRCAYGGPVISAIALNMLSDFVLAVWILPTLQKLQVDKNRRLTIAFLFCARAAVPLVAGPQAWTAWRFTWSDDPTWDGFYFSVFSQAVTGLSLIVASLPRIKRFVDLRCGDMMGAHIPDDKITLSTRDKSSAARGGESLKLVPPVSNKFTTTVISCLNESQNRNGKTTNSKIPPDWQKFVSMGSTQDEHASTSSLFEHQGVMMQQEVTVTEGRRSSATESDR